MGWHFLPFLHFAVFGCYYWHTTTNTTTATLGMILRTTFIILLQQRKIQSRKMQKQIFFNTHIILILELLQNPIGVSRNLVEF